MDATPTGLVPRHVLDADDHDLRAIAWSPDGRALLGVAGNGTAWLWDTGTGQVRWRVKTAPAVPSCVAWSPDGRYWLVGTWQGRVQLVGARSGEVHQVYRGIADGAIGVGWSADGDETLAVSSDRDLVKWEMFSGRVLGRPDPGVGTGVGICATWSPDLQSAALTFGDGRVECRHVRDWRVAWAVGGGDAGTANCAAWSPDGLVVACAAEGGIRAWAARAALDLWSARREAGDPWRDDAEASPSCRVFAGPTGGATWASFSGDGRLLAARTRDHVLLVWRSNSPDLVAAVRGEPGEWSRGALVAVHPHASLLAAVGGGGSAVHVWEVDHGALPPP